MLTNHARELETHAGSSDQEKPIHDDKEPLPLGETLPFDSFVDGKEYTIPETKQMPTSTMP